MPDELFLIDGNSLAYRAFFALPETIATSTGIAPRRRRSQAGCLFVMEFTLC